MPTEYVLNTRLMKPKEKPVIFIPCRICGKIEFKIKGEDFDQITCDCVTIYGDQGTLLKWWDQIMDSE